MDWDDIIDNYWDAAVIELERMIAADETDRPETEAEYFAEVRECAIYLAESNGDSPNDYEEMLADSMNEWRCNYGGSYSIAY